MDNTFTDVALGDLLINARTTVRVVGIDPSGVTLLVDGEVRLVVAAAGVTRMGGMTTFAATHRDALDNLSGADVIAIMGLGESPDDLVDVWNDVELDDAEHFARIVAILVGTTCQTCSECDEPAWADKGLCAHDGDFLCRPCYESYYFTCYGCAQIHHDNGCQTLNGDSYCEGCYDDRAYWCSECDEYDDHEHEHEPEQCECDPPHRRFSFPADGDGFVREDERIAVELPAGAIPMEGIKAIHELLWQALASTGNIGSWDIWQVIEDLEPVWQTKKGNFTRRLSSALHKAHAIKLPSHVISEVGNVARQHSSGSTAWQVEFTRNLNAPRDEFANGDSCWWSSHAWSRCCFKSWGGLGLRSYIDETVENCYPSGRAWVQPLDERLQPTHDAANAHAYVVYNGYGRLEGYTAARIVAHLTGRTYRKVTLSAGDQYVNSETGYLVADEATCEATCTVAYSYDAHDQLDAHDIRPITQEIAA